MKKHAVDLNEIGKNEKIKIPKDNPFKIVKRLRDFYLLLSVIHKNKHIYSAIDFKDNFNILCTYYNLDKLLSLKVRFTRKHSFQPKNVYIKYIAIKSLYFFV